jgi:hypothetical protein
MSIHGKGKAAKAQRIREVAVDYGDIMAVLDGLKTCITAPERLARQGEELVLKDGTDSVNVKVRLVLKAPLWFVQSHLWLKEGSKGPIGFELSWLRHYGNCISSQEVYVHVFIQH